ncbi:MAG: heparan-alpha-glucosaminide N-acetyltransferase domain-containing protein [Bacteroidota bacterium]|nr:heparan-alpha-glucosaminide N-acetyltransferase domain-containing protein [Bacteroidota bacterium]
MTSGKQGRLLSLDCLRGFDMLMISGAGGFLGSLENKTGLSWIDEISKQMEHTAWNGFTFEDFIFPLFLFIAGVSLSLSLNKGLKSGSGKRSLYRKAFLRMVILIGLGILYKNSPVPFFEPSHIRIVSVLGRIGFACFITTILYLNFSWRQRIVWVAGILLLYYAALFLIPVPGYGAGNLSLEGNLVGWFDRTFLPGRLIQKIYDENGLLTQFPALCLTILGTMAGDILRTSWNDSRKLLFLFLAGMASISLGLLWGLYFPVNKHLWSSSFILLTGGIAFLSLAFFYWIIDVMKYQKWTFFFRVIGLNSITVYLAYHFIDFNYTSRMLFSGIYAPAPESWYTIYESLGALVLVWLFLYFLYRKKIFLKI